MSDKKEAEVIEPQPITKALEKIISGEWKIAMNLRNGAFLGSFSELSKIFELKQPFFGSFEDNDVGIVDPYVEKFEKYFIFRVDVSNNCLWVPYDIRQQFCLDPFECLDRISKDSSKEFEYMDNFGGFQSVSKETLMSFGLKACALSVKWREKK